MAEKVIQLAFSRPIGPIFTEKEWNSCLEPLPMLRHVDGLGSKRKAILFVMECVRQSAEGNPLLDKQVMKVLECYTDESAKAENSVQFDKEVPTLLVEIASESFGPLDAARIGNRFSNGNQGLKEQQAELVREFFGNPYQPVAFDQTWRTPTVTALAQQMHDSQEFSPMPILADALQDAGCEDTSVLEHCRDELALHTRGCWVLDLILGRE